MSSTYILIDTTLIGYSDNKPWIKKRRSPSWVATIYDRAATTVSPILIDVERAWQCNQINAVMGLVNAHPKQLGISFIETELTMRELQDYLRQFIYIVTDEGVELTLRFADCLVLSALAVSLTSDQWATLVRPFSSWRVHSRDGKLLSLPIVRTTSISCLPLLLNDIQIASIREAAGADQLLANLRKMRPEQGSEYSTLVAHQHAQQTRQVWISAGHQENMEFLLFARDVFDTKGQLLKQEALKAVLEQPDPDLRRKDLQRLTKHINEVRK